MIIQLANVISAADAQTACDEISDRTLWVSGEQSADGRARRVKSNLQANSNAEPVRAVVKDIQQALASNRSFIAAARPANMAGIMLNRYDEGMAYGAHADAAFINNVRTDVSFTLFLSSPDQYDGGDLIIENPGGSDKIKLPAGGMALYPSSSIHRVSEVIRGTRLAAVGWVRSHIRSPEKRALLFEFDHALSDMGSPKDIGTAQDRLTNVRNNLLRLWAE